MSEQEKQEKQKPKLPQLFTPDGKPLKVLSTSLGIALLANALYSAGAPNSAAAETAAPSATASASVSVSATVTSSGETTETPVLTEWSNEAVKAYFDPSIDWNIPLPEEDAEEAGGEAAEGGGTGGSGGSGGGGTTFIHTSSGFGWDDLMLYHLIMGRGSSYSSVNYYNSHPAYDTRSGQAYKPSSSSYSADSFQNKAVVGSTVRPKTSSSSGSITRRSTSSSSGGIGGKSSGFSSSGSSSSKSSGGFGG